MEASELEEQWLRDSRSRFEDQRGRTGADASLILADALTYAAGATAFITAGLDAMETGWDARTLLLVACGVGLWLCSQSLNNFRRLLPVWLRAVLGMRILPETFEEQSGGARRRRMWTMVIAAALSAVVAAVFTRTESIMTRSGLPFHLVLWAIVLLDLLVVMQWARLIRGAGTVVRPGGWS